MGLEPVSDAIDAVSYAEIAEMPDFADDDEADVVDIPEPEPASDLPAGAAVSADAVEQPESSSSIVTDPAAHPAFSPLNLQPRELSAAELSVLDADKPDPQPTALQEPEGMQLIEHHLLPTYAALGKRRADGDWVTAHFKRPLVPREQTRVAVLGYHNFSNTKSPTDMRMKTAEFCRQMQFLKDSDICVISMQDFIEWRFGNRCLPEKCVLITIDDGWKSVYTDAYPVLKAYGYPFTVFLYVRFMGGQGDSLSADQIKEMTGCGATIGSHSWNHFYGKNWKAKASKPFEYAKMVKKELLDSRLKLIELFGNCSTYCYPGGYHSAPMRSGLKPSGYQLAFTVIDRKVQCDVDPYQVNRYMVFGTNTSIFRRAVTFSEQDGRDTVIAAINAAEAPARLFLPEAFVGAEAPLLQNEKTAAEKAALKTATVLHAEETATAPESAAAEQPAPEPLPPTEDVPTAPES